MAGASPVKSCLVVVSSGADGTPARKLFIIYVHTMSQRRLFSPDIVSSDIFIEMPASTQVFYFHLAMNADDDGFVNPRGIMRILGTSEDDLKILLAKRFLLEFSNGVVVIKHWLIHNTIRKDRYKPTRYLDQKSTLRTKENGSYTEYSEVGTLLATKWQPNGNQMATEVKSREVNSGGTFVPQGVYILESKEDEYPRAKPKPKYPNAKAVFSWFPDQQKSWQLNTTELKHAELLFERGESRVKSAMAYVAKHSGDEYFPKITKPSDLERKWVDLEVYDDKQKV